MYVIDVSNAVPSDATNVTMTNRLPYGTSYQAVTAAGWTCQTPKPGTLGAVITCTTATLADGSAASSSIAVKVRARPNRGALHNIATITSDTSDLNSAKNTGAASTNVTK